MAVYGHTQGRLLRRRMKLVIAVNVKVVRVFLLLLLEATTVYCESGHSCTGYPSSSLHTLSGMVHSVRVKVVAAALLHGSLWIQSTLLVMTLRYTFVQTTMFLKKIVLYCWQNCIHSNHSQTKWNLSTLTGCKIIICVSQQINLQLNGVAVKYYITGKC